MRSRREVLRLLRFLLHRGHNAAIAAAAPTIPATAPMIAHLFEPPSPPVDCVCGGTALVGEAATVVEAVLGGVDPVVGVWAAGSSMVGK